jgi:ABC-type antimicrobial peptide transport system permease subunit
LSETNFPVNDLFRRKLQTGLVLISLTICVASTLFLLLFADGVGFGIASAARSTLTIGFSAIFSNFLLFVGILVFAAGAVVVSFITFLMMAQRTRDFGLIKAAGCPNGLIFGYFSAELLMVLFVGCTVGVAFGFLADFTVMNMGIFAEYQRTLNFLYGPLVFAAFFIFGLVFGMKPLLNAARLSSIEALSHVHYFGLREGNKHKALSKSRLTLRIATRSLFRRPSTTVRIVFFLSVAFILLTVSITGSIIASDTTVRRVEDAIGKDLLLVAHKDMANQYLALLSKFSGSKEKADFDYLNPNYAITDAILQQIKTFDGTVKAERRLICSGHMRELMNFTFDPETQATISIGDNRETDALIIGVKPDETFSSWFIDGRFIQNENSSEAVVGDSVAAVMFEMPLLQSFVMQNATFSVVGLCLEPINNGFVTFVSLERLQGLYMVSKPNVALVELAPLVDRSEAAAQLQDSLSFVDKGIVVLELDEALEDNIGFLSTIWSVVMFLPIFSLGSVTLCLVAYLVLNIDEQRQEFAVLRVIGAKSKTIISILAVQALIVLFSSFAVGISLGVITTLMILIPQPVVTSFTILEIAGWLLTSLAVMFVLCLWPAVRFARKPILTMMS